MTNPQKIVEEFEKEFPPFRGRGARFPIFDETPVYTHITQFIERNIADLLTHIETFIDSKIKTPQNEVRETVADIHNQALSDIKAFITNLK